MSSPDRQLTLAESKEELKPAQFTLFSLILFLRPEPPARAGGVWEGELFEHLRALHGMHAPGVQSNRYFDFWAQTGRKTGSSSGPNSVLEHYKFRHVSKLQT